MLVDFINFVKTQIKFHDEKASFFEGRSAERPNDKGRSDSHRRMAQKFRDLCAFLESLPSNSSTRTPSPLSAKLGLSPEEIEGLPPELLEELSISESERADFAIISTIEEAGGVLSLDKILIAMYRKTGEINKRTQMNSKLYRIVQKGNLFNVPGRKGVYSTRQLTEEEAAALN